MVDLAAEIRAVLLTIPTITSAVGSGAAARIRPDVFAQTDAWPAILIEIDEEIGESDLQGVARLMTADVKITCRSTRRSESRLLGDAVAVTLSGYSASSWDSYIESVATTAAFLDDGRDAAAYDTTVTAAVVM